jgi:hypothetical protein
MTFQEDIEQLQIQFEKDRGHPSTDDVVEAIASFGYQNPKHPIYSFKVEMLRAWLMLTDAIKHAEEDGKKKPEEYKSFLERGISLQCYFKDLWNLAKDLPDIDPIAIIDMDPKSDIRKMYDATESFRNECQKLVHEVCALGKFMLDYSWYQSFNNSKRDTSGRRFDKKKLQKAIDAVRTKAGKEATKGRVREKLDIKDIRTFNKYLRELNVSDNDFKSAANGEIKLK